MAKPVNQALRDLLAKSEEQNSNGFYGTIMLQQGGASTTYIRYDLVEAATNEALVKLERVIQNLEEDVEEAREYPEEDLPHPMRRTLAQEQKLDLLKRAFYHLSLEEIEQRLGDVSQEIIPSNL